MYLKSNKVNDHWLPDKYGLDTLVRPHELNVRFKNIENTKDGELKADSAYR